MNNNDADHDFDVDVDHDDDNKVCVTDMDISDTVDNYLHIV